MAFHPYFKMRAAPSTEWQVPALYAAYGGSTGLPGRGKIGIIEMGGQYSPSDMTAFCAMTGMPEPTVINPQGPFPSDPDGADVEVNLDAQIAACVFWRATGQAAVIVFIWEASDQAAAVAAAKAAGAATFSCSWGQDESEYGAAALQAVDAAAQAAFPMVSFAASGDNDSSDGVAGSASNVDGPASCPNVIACGGTSKPQTGPEVVWNNNPGNADGEGTGGGISVVFPLPNWQISEPTPPAGKQPGRGVPDVAGCADPNTGYVVVSGGQRQVVGGTSCWAPFMAGFFAALTVPTSPVGPTIWANQSAFNDITSGNNGEYDALVGPDYCSGVGSPKLAALAAIFSGATPQPNPNPNPPPVPVPPKPPTPTPTPTPPPVPVPPPPPPAGDPIADAVFALQQALVNAGYRITPTGTMTIHTYADVRHYQLIHGATL